MDRREFVKLCGRCAVCLAAIQAPALAPQRPPDLKAEEGRIVPRQGFIRPFPSPYYEPLAGGGVRCTLCPHGCELGGGDRGACGVRMNQGGTLMSLAHANPCAVNVDPIEKKPFFHVAPGTGSFSLATAGCNLHCKFCQNWEISQAEPEQTLNYDLPAKTAVEIATAYGCKSVASTYVEPTIFIEYMLELGRRAKRAGLLNVMHSCGFVNEKPLSDLCKVLDAACIDLKGFTEEYYKTMTGGGLQPVLDSIKRLKAHGVFTELVTLVVPGRNDAPDETKAMAHWIASELSPGVPLHLTRFYPRYKLKSLPPTPVETLLRLRETARSEGLEFVYVGNVPSAEAENTSCPQCGALLIKRRGYSTRIVDLKDGRCGRCGREIPGVFV
ncbi:MAG: AmmeMemoRadiSam system radical SAM enzyme [Desulfovibrionaceae bacterium]